MTEEIEYDNQGSGYEEPQRDNNYVSQLVRQQFNIWQFSSDELIYVEETLKGKTFDREKGKWVKVEGIEPVMNIRGITEFSNWLRIQLDKKNQLSNLNERDVPMFACKLFKSIVHILLINFDDWGLKEEKLEYVYSLVEFSIYAGVLKRAYKGGAMQSISKTIHAIEQSVIQQTTNRPREKGLNR